MLKVTGCPSASVAVSVCTRVTPSATLALLAEVIAGAVLATSGVTTVRLLMLTVLTVSVRPMSEPSNSIWPVATVPPVRSVEVSVSATTSKAVCGTPARVSMPLTATSRVPAASVVPLKLVAWVSRCRPWIWYGSAPTLSSPMSWPLTSNCVSVVCVAAPTPVPTTVVV